MYATIDSMDGQESSIQQYLAASVLSMDSTLNLASIVELRQTFRHYLDKYFMLGGCLAAVLAFIGIMNFFNTTATSVLSRRRELALLEAVGMTKRQLQKMLIAEGAIYLIGAWSLSVLITLFGCEKLLRTLAGNAFFFNFQPTVFPSILMLPVLVVLACVVPHRQFVRMERESVMERLNQN